jgi:hypothetical protein
MSLTTLNLLHEADEAPDGKKRAWRRLLALDKDGNQRLSTSFAGAFAAHAALFFIFFLASTSSPPGSKDGASNLAVIRQALAEVADDSGNSEAKFAVVSDPESLAKAIDRSVRFSDETDRKKKLEIVKAMLRSFNRMSEEKGGSYLDLSKLSLDEIQSKIEEGTIRLPSGDKAFTEKGGDSETGFEFHTIDREDEVQVERLSRGRDKEKEDLPASVDYVSIPTQYPGSKGAKMIPPEVYFRECPYERILARGSSLFTAVRGFPEFVKPTIVDRAVRNAPKAVVKSVRRENADLLTVLLIVSAPVFEFADADAAVNSAEFGPDRMTEILNELMKKPEDEQFAEFDREYLKRFDPDSANLARFAGRFIYTNLNGVFYMADDFAMAFDFLEELYYKRAIYDAYLGYWRRHPKTKTAAEFLLGAAAAFDFERRTLAFLDAVEPEADQILASGVRRTSAFDFRTKAYVLKRMAEEVRAGLKKKGFPNVEAALKSYREASIGIYRLLSEMTGEIRNRALFSLGGAYWDDGDVQKAFEVWRKVDPDYDSPVFRYIKPYLDARGDDLSAAIAKIGNVIDDGAGRGTGDLLQRQLHYHKWANRVKTWSEFPK